MSHPPEAAQSSERESPAGSPAANVPYLPDPWSRRGALPLDGALERGSGLWPWLMALLVLAGTFIVFNVVGAVVMGVMIAVGGGLEGTAPDVGAADIQELVGSLEIIVGNSTGQVLGMALPVLLVAWLHSSRFGSFLRLRRTSWALLGLALLGMVGLQPVVGWLMEINQLVPLPEVFQWLEEQRMEMIYQVLESGVGVWVTLLGLAVVPALCEELAFRGYAQRQLERSAGAQWGIFLSGLLFGLYHLSPAQVLPLTVLGLYLAYLTWRTGSLWPAILVHFANNAFAVISAEVAASRADVTLAEMENTSWPWYVVVGGLILFAAVLYFLHTGAPRWRPGEASDE